jgi:hypothetical protein
MRDIAYANVDFCGNCGSYGGGTSKTIFSRKFDNACRTTFKFDDPRYGNGRMYQDVSGNKDKR